MSRVRIPCPAPVFPWFPYAPRVGDLKERILARRTLLIMAAAAACRRTAAEDSGTDTEPLVCLSQRATTDEEEARIRAELEKAELAAKKDAAADGSTDASKTKR